jgi:hydroxymethylglutaryl-CoA lyase
MIEKVEVREVGPRDGLQVVSASLSTAAKLQWIRGMAASGLRHIEVGSFVPARLVPQMADTEDVVRESLTIAGLETVVLVPNLRGAQKAHAVGVHKIIVPISVSESHSRSNTNKGTLAQVEELARLVDWVRVQERPMRIEAGCSTAFGCSMEGVIPQKRLVEVATAVAMAGVDEIALADTVGYATPRQVREAVRAVRAVIGTRLTKLHLHDTLGMGMANAAAGVEEGIRAFDAAMAGLGGCPFAPGASGNIVTEDLVFLLESMGLDTGIDLEALVACRRHLQEGLPQEPLRGALGKVGVPRTYRRATQ